MQLGRLPANYAAAADTVILSLDDEPLRGKALRGELAHLRSLRVGVYRILYRFDARSKTVIIDTIRHRSEAYRRAR
ncbi:MAG: type II toxin-antitoxin system RelE/ParE family toxin [Chloroflexota bacterium]|nr:type II toxin-antitoxin system RelE/ParE family toxin [Chloroflexota bacterium]